MLILLMLKQKLKFITSIRALFWPLVMGAILVSTTFYAGLARADQYDEQIQALQAQNAGSQSAANQLASQASSYEDAINKLQEQINSLQQVIVDNQNKSNDLQKQIDAKQIELDHQKQVLGESIKTMYVEGQISTLEILASSNNISDFVNKETYRTAMRNQIKTTVDTITQLKAQLQKQQDQLQGMIKDQQTQQAQLNSAQLQQSQMLAYTEGQKATYDQQIRANNSQIGSLRAAQAAAIAAATGNNGNSAVGSSVAFHNLAYQWCGGGYGYCSAGFDEYIPYTLNIWGLEYARECVHYVADTLTNRGYYIPYHLFAARGNANQWVGTTTGTGTASRVFSPQRDDVVYMPIGGMGHVAIVDYVNSDGTLHVSQMNWPYGGWYSTMDLTVTSNLQFLRFHK
jgi:peptidoglycan hydrolase CwlO-like protein